MKKHIKILIILLVLTIGLLSINQIRNVKADSGWDTSYDSGGSSSSGSSWGGGSSYDRGSSWSSYHSSSRSSSSSGKFSLSAFLGTLVLYAFLFIVCMFELYIKSLFGRKREEKEEIKRRKEKEQNRKKLQQKLNQYVNKTLDELEAEFAEKFVKIQNAWMNFDYDELKKLCSNEIYNTYYEELEALKLKKEQNIMSNFAKFKDDIINFSIENNILTIEYQLTIAFYDYVISTETDEVVKGNSNKQVFNVYLLKFSKKLDQTIENCPNCGGKIEPGTTTCIHCKATIVQDSNSFVMIEKRRVN